MQANSYAEEIEIYDIEGNRKNMEDYQIAENVETADVSGTWNLNLDFQGQEFPVTLVIEQNGDSVNGNIESMLGSGEIVEGKVRGNKFSAIAKTDFQGQSLELNLSGTVENDSMSGTVNTQMIPMPIEFSGTKKI